MSFRTSGYADRDLYTKSHRRYYQATAKYAPRKWTKIEDEAVMAHNIPDRELSALIHRSMAAIQTRRSLLWKLEAMVEKYEKELVSNPISFHAAI